MKHFTVMSAIVALALGLVVTATSAAGGGGYPLGQRGDTGRSAGGESSPARLKFRWDIVSYNFSARPVTVSAGGKATAIGSDDSKITFTGSGTFGGPPTNVSGGGNWQIIDARGNETGSGTYQVKSLVNFVGAPGTFGDPTGGFVLIDQIGNGYDARAGLAVLRIAYSDASQGILVLGSLQVGTPPPRLMGTTATKSFVAYWERQAPRPGIDGNRTLFHVVP